MTSTDSSFPGKCPDSIMIFGCGYVGTAVAKHYLGAGARVGALTRNRDVARSLRALGVSEVVEADLDTPGWMGQLKGDYQTILNCVSSAGGGLAGYQRSYIDGTRQILGWAEGRSIESMVYTSSTSVYPQDGGVWVDESADVSEASETGKLLIEAERMLESNGGQFGSWYVLRLSGIYGPGRHHLVKQLQEGDGVIPGRGDYHMNMVHLADIVQAIVCAISGTAPSGVYNLSDGHPAKKEQVLAYLAEQLNLPQPTFAPELVSPRLRRRGGRMPDRLITNQKAKDQIGWSPSYPTYRDGYASIFSSSPF